MSARDPSAAPDVDPLDGFPWIDFGHAVVNFETGQIVNMRGDDDGEDEQDGATPAGREAAHRARG